MTIRRATVLTHRRAADTAAALLKLVAIAKAHNVELLFPPGETAKHKLEPADGVQVNSPLSKEVDICLVLGGDGTTFAALRAYAGTGVAVFAVNFGEVGFLATVDPEGLDESLTKALTGDFDTLELPTIAVQSGGQTWLAVNDASVHRKQGARVGRLSYAIGGEEVGSVRCDGLVAATPQGSTGYNLANGGPILAWGVEGFVVSFIAPHSLTARPMVVAPNDLLTVTNSGEDPVEIHIDGRPVADLGAASTLKVSFGQTTGSLAQLPGASFYHRLRERFGRLAQ